MIEVFLGMLCGMFTGLIPGLHLNTFIPFLTTASSTAFVVGVVLSHSFFDFLPAMFLGVPEESTGLSMLPAHKMILRGKGLKAFKLATIGGVISSVIALVLLIPILLANSLFSPLPIFIILLVALLLTAKQSLYLFFLSCILGFLLFYSNVPSSALFLPLFGGLFGMSSIIFSFLHSVPIPKQDTECSVSIKPVPCILGALAGLFAGLLPGITCSVAASMSQSFHEANKEDFLVLIGGANSVYAFTSILAIFIIGKPRSGAAHLVQGFGDATILQTASFCLMCVGVLGFTCLCFAPIFIKAFNRARHLNTFSALLLIAITALLGYQAVLILIASTSLGLLCLLLGKPRRVLTATILFPALLFYII